VGGGKLRSNNKIKFHVCLLKIKCLILSLFLFACSPSTEDLYSKAYKLEQKNRYKEAIEVYNRIIKKHSKFQDAFFQKGYCFLQDSNYTKALECFEIVLTKKGIGKNSGLILEMNPDSPFASEEDKHQVKLNEVYYQMAIANYNIDSLKVAYGLFKYCSNKNYNTGNCYIWQGLIWTRYDSINRACDFFQKAKWLNEHDADRFIKEYCNK
jgi:tetratricopeptide (TPR) repeat protein